MSRGPIYRGSSGPRDRMMICQMGRVGRRCSRAGLKKSGLTMMVLRVRVLDTTRHKQKHKSKVIKYTHRHRHTSFYLIVQIWIRLNNCLVCLRMRMRMRMRIGMLEKRRKKQEKRGFDSIFPYSLYIVLCLL